MGENKAQFANFKDAFCAYYRIPPEKYARAVLWRALPFSRRLLALPILAFNSTFFATDLDIIRSLGAMQSSENFSLQLDELHAVNRLERNIRRGIFGIRASGSKLMGLWKTVEPFVIPPAVPVFIPVTNSPEMAMSSGPRRSSDAGEAPLPVINNSPRMSPAAARSVSRSSSPLDVNLRAEPGVATAVIDAADMSAVVIRRLKRACDDTVLGVPVEEAVINAGLNSVGQFMRLLESNSAAYPSFRWLLQQLRNAELLRDLESENAGLKAVLAEQTVELARVRGGGRR